MFGNMMKNLGDMAKLKSMQDALKKEEITHEHAGVKVTIRGDMQIQRIEIAGVENRQVADAINEAMKKIQTEAAKKLMSMGGWSTTLFCHPDQH